MAEFTEVYGGSHGDTKEFNDVDELGIVPGNARIYYIKVKFGDFVHGIRFDYIINGERKKMRHYGDNCSGKDEHGFHIPPGDYITHISGARGNCVDKLVFRTKNGKGFEAGGDGGDPFEVELPLGHTICGIKGGTNGDLHNISFAPCALYGPPERLDAVGGNHGDTQSFDDIEFLQNNPGARIASIKGWEGSYCLGLEVTYDVGGELISAGEHFGSNSGQSDP